MISGAYPLGQEVVNLANDAQNTADLTGSPLTAVDDQIFPTNLADVVTDGTFCVRNTPADVAAFGLGDHVDGDVLKKVGATWKRLLRPVAGTTFIWLTTFGKPAVFVDEPVAGSFPVFVNTFNTGEAFSVPYIGTDLPGQISFDGTLLIGNTAGGLTTADFGNAAVLLLLGTLGVWIRDTVNPDRSGVYNLIVNNAGTGDYTLRRDYNFRDSSSFVDGQTFFVGSGSGGDEANKNYLISLTQQFIINTTSLAIVEGTIANTTQPDKIISAFVSTEDVTVANTVAETTLLGAGNGSLIIPADTTVIGDRFAFSVQGILSSGANPTLRLQLKSGVVLLADTGAQVIGNLANGHWVIIGDVVTRTIGATGTVTISGSFMTSSGDHFEFVNIVPVTIDTTINRVVDVTAIWGTASAGNTITAQISSLTKFSSP